MTTHPHHSTCPGGDLCTLDGGELSDAEIASRRGWVVGTRIEGVLANGARREVKLTAIGLEYVLGVEIRDGASLAEDLHVLHVRCWGEVRGEVGAVTGSPHHPSCPGGDLCTLDHGDTDAEIARRRGWTVGTRIEGMKYGERKEIEIAAIGREDVLAVEDHWTERKWRLHARCWGEVKP